MLLKFFTGWWEVPILMDNPIWRASWYTNERWALPWAEDVANPAVITFIDFSKTFDSAALPRSPHLTHFLTDNWCQPRGCAVPWPPGTKRDPGTCRPNPPPTNRSVVQFTTTIQTTPGQEKVSQVFKIGLSTRQHFWLYLWKYDWFRWEIQLVTK